MDQSAAFLALGLCAQLTAAPNSPSVRVGLLLPPEEAEAECLRQGAALAVAWANQSTPPTVELVIRGRPGQWGDDSVEAGRMVLDDNVVGLIAPPGGMPTHLALQVAGRTATPVISLCGDSSVTGAGVPWSVRIVPGTTDEARMIMAGFVTTHTRWAALVPAERTGREIARDLSEAAAAVGCKLDPVIVVDPKLTDLSTLAPQLPRGWPDGILVWLDAKPAALAARALRAAGFQGLLAGPGRLRSVQFREYAGSALDGFVAPRLRAVPAAAELAVQFETDYRHAYDKSPSPTAALACDAVSLLIRLARRAEPGEIHGQFPVTERSIGVTGPLEFDRLGNRLVSLELCRFRDRAWTPLLPGGTGRGH